MCYFSNFLFAHKIIKYICINKKYSQMHLWEIKRLTRSTLNDRPCS